MLAADRVSGSEALDGANSIEDALFELLRSSLTQAEIDLFVEQAPDVLKWAESHVGLWMAADEADAPMEVIRKFEVWDEVDVTSSEFVALVGKLMFAREISEEPMNIAELESELAQMEAILKREDLPESAKNQARQPIAELSQLIGILKSGGRKSIALYEENQEVVDELLDRFQAVGEEAE